MTTTSRVDELRKRYHENPRRFFAPLANEYRKTGFTDRAILLCQKHLGEQPGQMNGLIVYGQCLFEIGRLEEARVPFEAALVVDGENLIALRHLGDIARLRLDHATARTWYSLILELDRRNTEVIALLADLGGGAVRVAAPSLGIPGVSVASSVSVAFSAARLDLNSAVHNVAAETPLPPTAHPLLPAAEPRSAMSPIAGLHLGPFSAERTPISELELREIAAGDAPALEGVESLEFVAPAPEVRATFRSIAMDHLSFADLTESPTSDLPLLSAFGELEQEPDPVARRASATQGLPLLSALDGVEPAQVDAAAPRRFERSATFVTETMAALYLQQGLRDRAIDVYRQLIARMPDDQGLRDRLRSLEQPADAPTADAHEFPAFESMPPSAVAAPAPTRRATAPRVSLVFDTPVMSDFVIEPPAPANAMLSAMSFDDVVLSTPIFVPAGIPTGPTAREFFSSFARRSLRQLSTDAARPSATGEAPEDQAVGQNEELDQVQREIRRNTQ